MATAASSKQSSSAAAGASRITIVELGHNSSGMLSKEVQVDVSRLEQLLQDPGQVDCPILEKLGYPVIIVSTTPGRKCIPVVQVPPVSRNPQNNRFATTAAARFSSGLAMGCVVGNAYVVRKDGRDLTEDEWWEIWEVLMNIMGDYGVGPGHVTDQLLEGYKRQLREALRQKGILKHKGPGSGRHCLQCGEEEREEMQLLRCSVCKTARYCSKECQKAHWRAGHKQSCRPPGADSEANRIQTMLDATGLKPEQIIEHNVALPPVPRNLPPQLAQLRAVMPDDLFMLFIHNRHVSKNVKICPGCRTRYRLIPDPAPDDRASKEQRLSGICSYACFRKINPEGGPNSGPEWFGQTADVPEGVQFVV